MSDALNTAKAVIMFAIAAPFLLVGMIGMGLLWLAFPGQDI